MRKPASGNLACLGFAALLALTPSLALAATNSRLAITETQARTDIRGDGYSKIENLRQEKNGWTATALEGGKKVKLLVNDVGVRKL
jgi:hypothetical protein